LNNSDPKAKMVQKKKKGGAATTKKYRRQMSGKNLHKLFYQREG